MSHFLTLLADAAPDATSDPSYGLTYFIAISFIVVSLLMILIVLVQRGRGGGVASAFGGGGGQQSAFGTKTGDVFTTVTCILFILFIGLAIGLNKKILADQHKEFGFPKTDQPQQNTDGATNATAASPATAAAIESPAATSPAATAPATTASAPATHPTPHSTTGPATQH